MIGEIISRYRVVDKLGAGGMGIVYRATDQQLNRDVALKVLAPTVLVDESARIRFRREARSLSQVNHPNICTIYEVGEANGQTYIAMELVDGRSLSELIPPWRTRARNSAPIRERNGRGTRTRAQARLVAPRYQELERDGYA